MDRLKYSINLNERYERFLFSFILYHQPKYILMFFNTHKFILILTQKLLLVLKKQQHKNAMVLNK